MSDAYNIPRDSGYKASDTYSPLNLPSNNYGTQSSTISLPIYQASNDQRVQSRRSKCPKGAKLGDIGSCCGFGCTRACAIPGDQ